jgi:hypothetical protein
METNGFICHKYVGGHKVSGTETKLTSKDALKEFLLSIPNPPVEYIGEFLEKL